MEYHTPMKKKIVIILILVLIISDYLSSLEFKLIPTENDTYDLFLSHDWEYRTRDGALSGFYSSIAGEQTNILEENDNEIIYYVTSGTTYSINSDILGYRKRINDIRFDVGFNFMYSNMDLRQIGYYDIDSIRHFMLNDRLLQLFLPRIKGKINYNKDKFSFSFGGEYAPWLKVIMIQELTFSPYYSEDFQEVANGLAYETRPSSHNAFSLNSMIKYDNLYVTPKINLEYDYLDIKYSMVGIDGYGTEDSLTQTLNMTFTLALNFIKINGINPTVTYNKSWDWYTNQAVVNPEAVLSTTSGFGFGFTF